MGRRERRQGTSTETRRRDREIWTGSTLNGNINTGSEGGRFFSLALGSSEGVTYGLLGGAGDAGPIDSGSQGDTATLRPLYGLSQVFRASAPRTTEEIRIVSTAPGRTYAFGEAIAVQATFSAPVAVRGVPGIDLQVGERVVVARYFSGSGTDRLRFEYVIMLGDHDDNGIGLSLERDSESPFRLDGAAIVDAVAGAGITVDLKRTTLTGGAETTGSRRVRRR